MLNTSGEARTFEIHGKHEFNGGFGKTSEENKSERQLDLKGGNLNVGGSFGHHGGKFEFGNGGEAKTFEIHERHKFTGGFGKSSEENNSEGKPGFGFNGKPLNIKNPEEKDKANDRQIKFGGKFGHGHGSIEQNGKIDIDIKGGNKGSSEEKSSEENKGIKFGGKFGHGHGSVGEHGKIDINLKGGNKGSSEDKSSEENKGIKFGGKFGHGHGSVGEHGKIDINLKGGNKGSSEDKSSEENKGIKFGGKFGHGHGSVGEHGKIDINLKGGNKGSSEDKSSEENKEKLAARRLQFAGFIQTVKGFKRIKFGGKFGHGHGSVGEHGKIDINLKGGNKGSSEDKSSEENKEKLAARRLQFAGFIQTMKGFKGIKFGGKFGHGHGSVGEHGKIDINIKGGNKGSSEENSSEGNKGIKFGGKFGHGHGSKDQNGKIDVNIKGRNEESSEEKSSEEKKGDFKFGGKFSHEHGGHGKGRSSESSEENNSEEHEEFKEKSSFEDIDLDFGTAPTYNPEFTIEPVIIPQTAQLLFQGPVTPNQPVEPEVPVNTPEPEAPVQPEIPKEPEQPIPVTESPPSNGKSCTFNAQFVRHGQTVELACSTCTCDDGSLTCVKNLNCPGVCSVIGLQMIRTFDGTLYESPGNCDYVLVKTSDFTISLDNERCSELGYDNYNPDATCIKSVNIYIPQKATINLLYNGTIQSSGQAADLPYSILDTITVLRSSSVFLDVATPLMNIQYDWVGNRLYVILDQSYKDHTAGLCGTYNDNRNDDYRSSNDMTETVSSLFSKSWKTQYQCSEDTKDPQDIGQKADADWVCSDALDNSLFQDCALLIDTHSYKISCSTNVYYLNENEGLCAALADYAYRCARAGIFVPVSSSFPDCSPVCKESMVAITEDSLPQQDCAEYTSTLMKITSSIPLNEVCICPSHLYYDASLDECVKGDYCPCYSNNRLYKLGEIITQADGQTCPCERITQCGDKEEVPPETESCQDNEIYADCHFSKGKLCEPSCMNLAILDTGCSLQCTPGCVCKSGFLRSSEGNCVPMNECPCIHGEEIYVPGATLAKDCNTCTCENGKFSCTDNPCNKVCNAYGGSQFFLFDNVWKSFDTKQCPIVLVESLEGETPIFRVVMQNAPNEVMGGALLKKTIHIVFGGASVVLSEFDTTVVHEVGSTTQLKTYRSGFYQVVHFLLGLAVYYDQHLDVIIQLAPQLQGKVQGMCGDADGTTTTELAISNMAQYASQFLTEVCPDQQSTLPPPSDNHKKFVETKCSLLKGEDFSECHTVVNVDPYYVACVEETEACREGESCLCYCTALAAYARACCRKGITIDWRSTDTCPSPCEYYNRDGGEGPYRIVMMNGNTLVIDYDNNAVSLENDDVSGNPKASFMVTQSLYVDHQNGRKLISLESAQHHNYFIVQNDDETLSLRKWQPSVEFRKRATFILRSDRWVTGYNALESYTSRGLYLSNNGDALVMSKVKSVNMLQMNFKLIEESFGLPSFSICTWKYRSCGSPCIATCQDPLATKCTLTLKVEGCYPICAPEMVFDEVTHRCVQIEDCVTPPVGPSPTTKPTSPVLTTIEACRNVVCKIDSCADGEYLQQVDSSDPCCPKYECFPIPPLVTTGPPTEQCSNVVCSIEPCGDGEYLQQVDSSDPCCPKYECFPILPPVTTRPPTEPCSNVVCSIEPCGDGEYLQQVDSSDPCCPKYECFQYSHTRYKITSLLMPGGRRYRFVSEPCKNVLCEPPVKCTKNGAGLVEIPWENICCPRYECQCQVTCDPPPICQDSSPPFRIGDPEVDCCPAYECIVAPITTPPTQCAGVTCPTVICTGDGNLVEVASEDPCCQKFECFHPEPTSTPNACDGVTCAEHHCSAGESLLVKQTSDDPCCPAFECVPTETTPPPVWTPTPGISNSRQIISQSRSSFKIKCFMKCDNVNCQTVNCFMTGSKQVLISVDDCCPIYDCECDPCSPAPVCNGNKPIMTIDPEMDCCPKYKCPDEATPPPRPISTTPAPTTPEPCKDVLCDPINCVKKGSTLDIIPWAESCCPHFVCICKADCNPIPICDDGRPPVRVGDPDTECCPEYKCEPPLPPSHSRNSDDLESVSSGIEQGIYLLYLGYDCANVICPVIWCAAGEIPVEYDGDDPCCRQTECVPITPVPTVPPTPPLPCDSVTCIVPECRENEKRIVKIDSNDPCCPLYECAPSPTPPSTTTPEIPEYCNYECPVKECPKIGSFPILTGGDDPCCPQYRCECQPCDPAPICDENIQALITDFNIDLECCPIYKCPISPETTTPIIITTPVPTPSAYRNAVPFLNVKTAHHQSELKTLRITAAQNTYAAREHLECSDHNMVSFKVVFNQTLKRGNAKTWNFRKDDFNKFRKELKRVDWEYLMVTGDTDHKWGMFKDIPLEASRKLILSVPPVTAPPQTTQKICDVSLCEPNDCDVSDTVLVKGDPEGGCCPIYQCIPPPTPPPETTPTSVSIIRGYPLIDFSYLKSFPADGCYNHVILQDVCVGVVCHVEECTKQGSYAVSVGRDECCETYSCVCQPCSPPPICEDLSVTINAETQCCPIYECHYSNHNSSVPPTLEPPVTPEQCQGVTCVIPTCREDYSLIEVSSNDPCCKSYECNPPPTTSPPTPAPPCDFSGCAYTDCDDGYTLMVKFNPEDDCCPTYECIPPPTSPPPPPTPRGCEEVVCSSSVEDCTRAGAVSVVVDWENECCPIYQCQCQPCSPAPVCENPFVIFDPNTQCCPSFVCPPPTPAPTPEEPCSNRVCEPIICTKQGATAERREWADPCCPLYVCECTEACSPPPECQDGSPPFRTQDPELHCCPEYACLPPTLEPPVTPGECQGVTCVVPPCQGDSSLVEVTSNDPCCKSYQCIPPPEPPTPSPSVSPCDGSGCSHTDCDDGYTLMVKYNPEDDCCPIYECIPPPTLPPTPPTPPGCEGVVCNVEECTKEGAVSVAVGWENDCCPVYQCQCQPCSPPLNCGDENLAVHFDPNIQCCPIYECIPPTTAPTTTPKPNPCENRVCEPLTCTKQGATIKMREWADPCCPLFVCECTEQCRPPPECLDGQPPFRTQDPELYCCPEYECVPPTLVPVTPGQCDDVTCTIPTCYGDYSLIRVSPKDPCCDSYECIPPPTTSPPTPKPPCDASGCAYIDCDDGYTVLTKHNPDDDCCPIYECIPPPTSPPEPTPNVCSSVVCSIKECTKEGTKAEVVDRDNCCDIYECKCQPCSPPPYCDGQIPFASINGDTQCCPTYECPPPPPPTPSIPIPTTPNQCQNRVCEPVTCSKQGTTPELREWADPCCPLYVCECTEQCNPPPECQDGSPPFRTQDPELHCCPEYACLPPTSEPFVTPGECQGITCVIPPCYGDYSLIEVSSNDPCCKSYECIPPPTIPICDGSGCPFPNCDESDTVMSRFDPDDECCPIFECIPPSTTSIPRTTPPPELCKDVVCEVTVCTKEGEIEEFISQDNCCEVHACRCQPCSPPPLCDGGQAPFHSFDTNTQCCPSYQCPPPTPPETPPPIITITPENPCNNRLCEPVECTKVGATVSFNGWIDACCPQISCECRESCNPPPTCANGSPPLRTQDPDEYCCPEYECVVETTTPVPTTTPEPPCQGVTCFVPTCGPSDTLVEVTRIDPCCPNYECVPQVTNPPPPTPPICNPLLCPNTPDCSNGVIIVKSNPYDACCPIYECRVETTPNPIIPTPSDCADVSCAIKECTKEGETLSFVGWLNHCCRDYECKCQPCSPPPNCDGGAPIANINLDTQCCPTYVCGPPPPPLTTAEPPTTIISSTAPVERCEDRECPVKLCNEQERLVTQINPADPCCPTQTCECACKTIPSCESDERLVAVQQSNHCCPKLRCEKKRDECYAIPTHVTLSIGQCSAEVILASCSGYCHSKTEYSDTWTAVSHCRCCSVTKTRAKTFELPCRDGSKTSWTVQEASECGCNKCSEEDGSGSGSGNGGNSGSGEEEGGEEGSGFSLWSSLGFGN
ncbi:uncharacterized protein [Dendrobates tinctorius]|uniref:uncharacterized protein n=1 Tax=Dendrobates tinctorius TaxID=92724 RepID=UPI003CCA5D3D